MWSLLRLVFALVLAVALTKAMGQCDTPIDLGPDVDLCAGQTLSLSVPAGYQSYQWSTGATGTSILVATEGTYGCSVTQIATGGNLALNGDFGSGLSGFSSDYVLGSGGPWGLVSNEGTYAVTTSPNLVHSNFAAFGDHTPGTGNMLVVNGAAQIGQDIWCQTISVAPNTDYAFSAWLASATFDSPAQLSFVVDGTPIGNLNATAATGVWLNFYSLWNSGLSTSVTVCITNLNTSVGGNDFALDDIAFTPFCTYTDEVVVTFNDYPAPDLGPDTSYCTDQNVVLDPQWPGADNYNWQNGSTSPTFDPSASGIYWVDVTESGCTTRDSVTVIERPVPVVDLGADGQRCAGDLVTLDASFPGADITWQDGISAATYAVTGSGTYWVEVDLNGCLDRDTVSFTYFPLPVVDLGRDTAICVFDSLVFDVFRPGGTYAWEDGSSSALRTVRVAGTYTVAVIENGCSTLDAIELETIELPTVDLGPDRTLCAGAIGKLVAAGPGYQYLWDDGSVAATRTIVEPNTYWVVVSNVCGTDADTLTLALEYCDCPVYVPNAFTADDDGINEELLPVFTCPVLTYTLRIFDRWGLVQWESNDPLAPWDGGGLPAGVYAWTLEYQPSTDVLLAGRSVRGHVVMLR